MKRLISRLTKCDGLSLVAKHGTGVQGGKIRIYNATFSLTKSELVKFVKSECSNYGFGGHCDKRSYLTSVDFFGKNVKYSYNDEKGVPYEDCTATYKELTEKILELIEKEKYLNMRDKLEMCEVGGGQCE